MVRARVPSFEDLGITYNQRSKQPTNVHPRILDIF